MDSRTSESRQIQPDVSSVFKPTTASANNEHHYMLKFGYIALIIIVLTAAGVYEWQHIKVDRLNNQVSSLTNKVTVLNKEVSSLKSTTTTSSISSDYPGFQAAKLQWQIETKVSGTAAQNPPLELAIADLQVGLTYDKSNTSGYADAIAALKNLVSLPITDVTPSQSSMAGLDVAALNKFFGI